MLTNSAIPPSTGREQFTFTNTLLVTGGIAQGYSVVIGHSNLVSLFQHSGRTHESGLFRGSGRGAFLLLWFIRLLKGVNERILLLVRGILDFFECS